MARHDEDLIIESEAVAHGSRASAAIVAIGIAVLLALVVIDLDADPGGLTAQVIERMDESGVEHPVTAVLLNFRAYDTWLELAVLFLGILGVMAVRGERSLRSAPRPGRASPVLDTLVRLLVPLMVLTAGYLLWLGKFDAGGAFQAGVVLAVALVLLWFSGLPSAGHVPDTWLRAGYAAGLAAFMAVALVTLAGTAAMLDLPPQHAGSIILLIEIMATVSIGVTIAALLIGLQPVERGRQA